MGRVNSVAGKPQFPQSPIIRHLKKFFGSDFEAVFYAKLVLIEAHLQEVTCLVEKRLKVKYHMFGRQEKRALGTKESGKISQNPGTVMTLWIINGSKKTLGMNSFVHRHCSYPVLCKWAKPDPCMNPIHLLPPPFPQTTHQTSVLEWYICSSCTRSIRKTYIEYEARRWRDPEWVTRWRVCNGTCLRRYILLRLTYFPYFISVSKSGRCEESSMYTRTLLLYIYFFNWSIFFFLYVWGNFYFIFDNCEIK